MAWRILKEETLLPCSNLLWGSVHCCPSGTTVVHFPGLLAFSFSWKIMTLWLPVQSRHTMHPWSCLIFSAHSSTERPVNIIYKKGLVLVTSPPPLLHPRCGLEIRQGKQFHLFHPAGGWLVPPMTLASYNPFLCGTETWTVGTLSNNPFLCPWINPWSYATSSPPQLDSA